MTLFRTVAREFSRLGSPSGSLGVICSRFYHKTIVDHFDNPRNVGSFDKSDPNVGTGKTTQSAAGDWGLQQDWLEHLLVGMW